VVSPGVGRRRSHGEVEMMAAIVHHEWNEPVPMPPGTYRRFVLTDAVRVGDACRQISDCKVRICQAGDGVYQGDWWAIQDGQPGDEIMFVVVG